MNVQGSLEEERAAIIEIVFRKERWYELGSGKATGTMLGVTLKTASEWLVARQTPGICLGGLLLGRRTRAMLRDWDLGYPSAS